ncbi:hypothetical protein ACFLQ5_04025, partial [Bacteroidota bacterium]
MNSFILFAQEEEIEKLDPSVEFTYYKYTDNSKALKTRVMARNDEGWYPIINFKVQFYSVTDTAEVLLAEVSTNNEGIAKLMIHQDYQLPMDTAGIFKFIARTSETELYESAEEEIEKKDLFISIELDEIDSVRTILISAKRKKSDGTEVMISEEDINIYVPRMFSDLKMAEG